MWIAYLPVFDKSDINEAVTGNVTDNGNGK
jgi:hypothetical protein